MKTYGYARVSSADQHADRQMAALVAAGVAPEDIYTDRRSGRDFARPAWRRLMRKLRKGDLLVVQSIDRMGRNYDEMQEEWRRITKSIGADVQVLDMALLDTRLHRDLLGTLIADLVLKILAYCAHAERDAIRTRQRQGISAAKARGVLRSSATACENSSRRRAAHSGGSPSVAFATAPSMRASERLASTSASNAKFRPVR